MQRYNFKSSVFFLFFQAEDGIRDVAVTGVQTCALPICFFEFAQGLAARVLGQARPDDSDRIRYAFRLCLGRFPKRDEELRLHEVLTEERARSEEHTSELQSRLHLVCRLLLEKKKHTDNKAAAPSQEAFPNQHEPQLPYENSHNDTAVHGWLNSAHPPELQHHSALPDIVADSN